MRYITSGSEKKWRDRFLWGIGSCRVLSMQQPANAVATAEGAYTIATATDACVMYSCARLTLVSVARCKTNYIFFRKPWFTRKYEFSTVTTEKNDDTCYRISCYKNRYAYRCFFCPSNFLIIQAILAICSFTGYKKKCRINMQLFRAGWHTQLFLPAAAYLHWQII
jgi:hypothetical protein